jgi:lipoate-protein ligase B
MPGVWVNDAEISSVGIYVSHGITMHGLTLNINTDLKPFSYITVCGLPGKKITSVEQIRGLKIPVEDFITPVIQSFNRIFQLDIRPGISALPYGYNYE